LEGDGGARKVLVGGLGARERAGEKCCWRVENAGREAPVVELVLALGLWLSWWAGVVVDAADGGRMSVEVVGGKSCVPRG
jgi:hypothetical protein